MAAKTRQFKLSAIISVVDRVSRPVRAISTALNRGIIRPFGKASLAVAAFGARLGKLAATSFAIGGIAALAGVTKAVTETADEMDKMAKSARQVGMSVEQFSALAYAADLSGVSLEELTAGMRPFTKATAEARQGTGALFQLLDRNSPAVARALKSTQTQEEAFLLLAGAIGASKDPAVKAQIAMTAFGEAGAKMASLFADGADGVRKMTDEAKRLGFVISTESATAAEDFNDDLNRMRRSFGGLVRVVGTGLIPVLDPLIERLTGWLQANQGIVSERVAAWVDGVGSALAAVDWAGAWDATVRFKDAIDKLISALGGLDNILGALVISMGVSFVSSVAKVTASLAKLTASVLGPVLSAMYSLSATVIRLGIQFVTLAVVQTGTLIAAFGGPLAVAIGGTIVAFEMLWGVMMANPIIAFGALFVAAAGLVYKYWEPISGFFSGIWDSLKGSVAAVWEYIRPIFAAIGEAFDAVQSGLQSIGVLDGPELNYAGASFSGAQNYFNKVFADSAPQSASKIDLNVKFDNAPAGLRVDRPESSGAPIGGQVKIKSAPAGRRTFTTGGPL